MRKERPHIVNHNRFKTGFVYAEVYAFKVQSNIFVARVLHFSAFITFSTDFSSMQILSMYKAFGTVEKLPSLENHDLDFKMQ